MVDMRWYRSRDLLASPLWGDQLLAILAKHGDRSETIPAILNKITEIPKPRRADALAKLIVLAGLRKAGEIVEEESTGVQRFGCLPRWAQAEIEQMAGAELDEALVRVLDARSLDEKFGRKTATRSNRPRPTQP